MRSRPFGVAIVGLGGMGSEHARLISTIADLRIIGACDIQPDRQVYAKEMGYHVYDQLQDVLNDPEVHIVLIATPNHVHKEIAISALEAGKAVISEKPVTMNSAELLEIYDVAQKTGQLFTVHQNRRFDEDFLVIKRLVDEGALGNITHIEQRIHGSRGIPGDWRQQSEFGGGMLLDWGVHLVDRLLIMIKEKVTHVYCQFTHIHNNEVDDGFRLFVTFESGKTALMEVGTANYINLPLWYVTGTTGTAMIENWSMNGKIVHLMAKGGHDAVPIVAGAGLTKTMAPRIDDSIVEEPIFRIASDVRDFYRNIADTLEGKAQKIVKDDEVLRVMRLLEAAFESDRTKQVVTFE